MANKNGKVGKKELCEWTCRALQRTLIPMNIHSGFRKARIWPLDRSAATHAMCPSSGFGVEEGGGCESGGLVGSLNESPDPESQDLYLGIDHARPIPGRERTLSGRERTLFGQERPLSGQCGWEAPPLERHGQEGSSWDGRGCNQSASRTALETDAEACDNVDRDVDIGGVVPLEHNTSPHVCPCHYYMDVPHTEESTYDVHERNVPIDPAFHVDLEE